MHAPLLPTLSRATTLAAVALLVPAARAQQWEARPYGPEGAPIELALGHAGPDAALEVFGGRPGLPAGLVLGDTRGERPLPGGQSLLVAGEVRAVFGRFDAAGRFVLPLAEVPELLAGSVHAQGLGALAQGGFAFTRGLVVEVREEEPQEPAAPALPAPPLEQVLVEELVALFDGGLAEDAMALALNSPGDALTLDVAGELQVPVPNPVIPTLAVGGKAGFKAKVARGTNQAGAPVYDLSIAADVASTAGVSAGPAGAGLASGQGGEVIWRYTSAAEVVRAIRCMAILQATGPGLERACQLVDEHTGRAREALHAGRDAADAVRSRVRERSPLRNVRAVRKLRELADERREQRRELVDGAFDVLDELVQLVADARTFLDEHVHGIEVRRTHTLSGKVGVGDIGDADAGGSVELANVGANLGASVERQLALRTELVPETGGLALETKLVLTKKVGAGAGFGVGIEGELQRVLELANRQQIDAAGYASAASGTTAKLALDGKLALALGVVVSGKAAVNGQVQAEVALDDLLAYGEDAIGVLLGDDEAEAAQLLRSLPIRLTATAGYEAGFGFGLGVNLGKEYFKAGVSAAATYGDRFATVRYEGGSDGNALQWMLENGIWNSEDPGVLGKLDEVGAEVGRVLAR